VLSLLDYQAKVLSRPSVLSPETWPFDLKWLPQAACLVGGSVRDALLDRHSEYLDLDFVLPSQAVETAQAIARHYRAGFVLLDPERQIARVVFDQGTADFALQVGSSLESDLRRRDFTVNAIAYNPHTRQLLDPLEGYQDLQKKRLRMVSPANLAEDPLRLLRAYRQAAQLSFSLDPETQQVIRQLAAQLDRIAAERVQSELNYLLNTAKGTAWLKAAWQDGLLQSWFPHAQSESLHQVEAIDQACAVLQETYPEFWNVVNQRIRAASEKSKEAKAAGAMRNWVTIAKLASLMRSDPEAGEAQLWRLKYSRAEIQAASTVLRGLLTLRGSDPQQWTLSDQYFFFQTTGAAFAGVALLAIASQSMPLGQAIAQLQPMMSRFLDDRDPVAHPTQVLTGQDLMGALKLPAGPKIGRLLAALQLARAEGKISSRDDAIALAKTLVEGIL
jgi:tRNA nucleotidyltransferase (CCA-adding enzyme)